MTEAITEIRMLTPLAICIRIFATVILGGIIGLERGIKNRPAGLRTYMLVSLGACIVMLINQYIYQAFNTGDPVRMGAQVISGIGFLGAGTIIVTSRNQIKGLTTAAGLWAAAAVGLAVGIGLYEIAVVSALMIFFILTVLHNLDARVRRNTRVMEMYIELSKKVPLGAFLREMRSHGIEPSEMQLEQDNSADNECASFIITLKGPRSMKHAEMIKFVHSAEGIVYCEEL